MLTKNDIDQIRQVVKEEVKPLDKKLDKAQVDIAEILTALDQHQTMLERRVGRIEENTGITNN